MPGMKWFSVAVAVFLLTFTAMFYSTFAQGPATPATATIQPVLQNYATVTADRLKNPEDNNERQSIHEHVTADLAHIDVRGIWHAPAAAHKPVPMLAAPKDSN